ncbi:MAG: hypothetical protein IT450_14530 [Phycisphaerales bacterium]|nr:hypothetical protein [Phycisphaerales bacterium]
MDESVRSAESKPPQPGAADTVRLVEICAPKSWGKYCLSITCLIILILGLGGGVSAIVPMELDVLRSMLVFLAIVLPAALPSWFETKSRERRVRSALRNAGDDPAGLGADLARGLQPPQLIPLAARELVKHGHRGLVVRICTAAPPAPVIPITVPFEPCSIEELTRRLEDNSHTASAARTQPWSTRHQRTIISLVLFSFAIPLVVVPAIGFIMGRLPVERAFGVPAAFIGGLGFLWFLQLVAPYRLLIPSGIVKVQPRLFGHTARLQQFFARDSVLVLIGSDKNGWTWTIANESGELRGPNINNAERMAALLGAWFSPLPPPTPEMLASLRGG